MKIFAISGSVRSGSANQLLLQYLANQFSAHEFILYDQLSVLPIFTADLDQAPIPESVQHWRTGIASSDALIISTPEYLHNLPALLKNALEWLKTSGELYDRRVLPVTFTPHPPRGEKAMQSLIWSLQALKANIVGQLDLYQSEILIQNGHLQLSEESEELLKSAIGLLES